MKKLTGKLALLLLPVLIIAGCGDGGYGGTRYDNLAPNTWLSSGPPEGITNTTYRVHFFWNGYDPDGEVKYFQAIVTDDWITGSLIIDENIAETLESLGYEWTDSIVSSDSLFVVEASQIPDPDNPDDAEYFYGENDGRFLFFGQHTLFLRAVDEFGKPDPMPAHRSFTSTTIAPSVNILHPQDTGTPGGWENLPPDIFFTWSGNDSVGGGSQIIEPDSTRVAIFLEGENGIDSGEPEGSVLDIPEEAWSRWRGWDEPEDSVAHISGTGALAQNLTPSGGGSDGRYLFLVQAKDEAGAVTSHYRDGKNLKMLRITSSLYPRLYAAEPTLGLKVATNYNAYDFTIGEGQPLHMNWSGDASHYGSQITGYRHGWDIEDTENDEEWSNWSLNGTSTTASYISGTHSVHIQCQDYSGNKTTMLFRFLVVPFTMEKPLLLIDDFDNDQFDEGYPVGQETAFWTSNLARNDDQMKEFWEEMLGDYETWHPEADYFRVNSLISKPPFELVASYQHIVWEAARTPRDAGLYRIARFVDPWYSQTVPFDYLSAFMERGGQLFLCGSTPLYTVMPSAGDMPNDVNRASTPIAYMRHLNYVVDGGEVGVARYLPYKQFGIDVLMNAVESDGRDPLDGLSVPYKTDHTHWGMVAAETTYLEFEEDYGIPDVYHLPDTLQMSPETLDWFEYAAEVLENHGGHGFIGVPDAEIYNWDWYGKYLDPPVPFRTNEFIPLLNYVVADNTTRFGTNPIWDHEAWTNDGRQYHETYWAVPYVAANGDTVYGGAMGPEYGHTVAMIGIPFESGHRNVTVGFHPYYLDRTHAKLLVDHILVDILGVSKTLE
jgi:hypothetical protein